jgi:hypothetical protein
MLQVGRARVRIPMRSLNCFNFPIFLVFLAALVPGVYSAFNRNVPEEEKSFWGIERGRRLRLTSSTSESRLSRKMWAQNPMGPRPVTGIALLYGDGVCFL